MSSVNKIDLPDRELLDAAPDAMIVVSGEGEIVMVNKQAEALFGYSREALLGQAIELLLPNRFQENHPDLRRSFGVAARFRSMGEGQALFGRRRDGTEVPVEISLSPMQTAEGLFVASAIRDVTHRREIERQLTEAKEIAESATSMKSRFLAAASHDLRQPLQSIGLYLSVVQRQLQKLDEIDHIADVTEKMRNSLEVMTVLLEALLDVSKFDSGSVVPEFSALSVQELFDQLITESEPLAKEKSISLSCESTAAIVKSDHGLLRRVVENFVSNAIRYTSTGSIILETSDFGDVVRIDVIDTGPGIPDEDQSSIFDEYFQLDNPDRDRTKGLGLGLAIVKHIAKLLDHQIEVDSKVGVGSRFSVFVPKWDGSAAVLADSSLEGSQVSASLQGWQVLIIEDDPSIVDAIVMFLELSGMDVSTACDGDEAITLIESGYQPDMLLSDYRLPGDNGVEVIKKIRSITATECPTVMMTGDTSAREIENANLANLVVLRKPVDTDHLMMLIEKSLHGSLS